MACDHRWKRFSTPPRDHVRCTLCDAQARALAPTRTGLEGWTLEPLPAPG